MDFIQVNSNWQVLIKADDFTDERVCTVIPSNIIYSSIERIYIRIKSIYSNGDAVALIGSGNYVENIGLRYRVDKNLPVHLVADGKTHPKYGDMYRVDGDAYKAMISAFKSGNEVVYQFTSGNSPANNKIYKYNLLGFTEAFNFARLCDYQ